MSAYEFLLRLTFILAGLAGLLSCLCFAKPSLSRWLKLLENARLASVCDEEHYAAVIVPSRWNRMFGVPNWWIGAPFYVLTLLAALWTNVWIVSFALLLSIFAALCSLVLVFALVFRLKSSCRMCYVAHIANGAIFITWVIALWQATK